MLHDALLIGGAIGIMIGAFMMLLIGGKVIHFVEKIFRRK
jgi:hypothetical protein